MKRLYLLLGFLLFPSICTAQVPASSGVTTSNDAAGHTFYTFSFPGYAKFELGNGIGSPTLYAHCFGQTGASTRTFQKCIGLFGYWDLKNDASAQWDFGADNVGMFEHQWHLNNNGGGTRIGETKEGPMVTTITEDNNVRVVITQTGKIYPFGDASNPQDCCVTMTKVYTFYRHGGAGTGTGASKVFTKTTLNYDGTDGLGPLNIITHSFYDKISWYKISGEDVDSFGAKVFEASPWNILYNTGNYILYSPVVKNSSIANQFLPANTFVSPAGAKTGPEGDPGQDAPGTIYNCVTPTVNSCGSQTISSAIVKANFFQAEPVDSCTLETMSTAMYFQGGLRISCNSTNTNITMNTNSPVTFTSVGWLGDNGITSTTVAATYASEYRSPPTMTPTNATGGTFDTANGYWSLARTADTVSISANGILHSPAWLISNWSATSNGLTVGGLTKTINVDFVAVKTDATHLLVEYLADVPSSTTVTFPTGGNPIVTPALPVANQGTTIQFTADSAGTWTCAGTNSSGGAAACAGSINSSTGLYTAPASVTANNSYAGFQLLPNNHVYNSRVDSLTADTTHGSTFTINTAVRSGNVVTITITSATPPSWFATESVVIAGVTDSSFNGTFPITTVPGGCSGLCFTYAQAAGNASSGSGTVFISWIAGAGTTQLTYLPAFNFNFADGSTPTQSQTFLYTPENNGVFQFPTYPTGKVESGWLQMLATPTIGDQHIDLVDIRNGIFTEFFDPMTPAQCNAYAGGTPNCTALSGLTYPNSTYLLPADNATDAAGLYIMPLSLHLQELEQAVANSGSINHALRFTLNQGYCASSFVWPGTSYATDGGTVPFAVRARLKASFDISSFSPIAKILLTQLKNYGIILADGGTGWQITVDHTKWPAAYVSAFNELSNGPLSPSNFEFVDESGLEISATSGLTTNNREKVTFTRTSDSVTTTVDVALIGVTVNMRDDQLYFMAGTPAQQIVAYVNGTSNPGLTWSMSPSVGVLGATGIYTPPGSVASPTVTTITATSQANGAIAATLTLTVLPSPIRVYSCQTSGGFLGSALCASNYTDTHGNTWFPFTGDDGGAPSGNSFGGTPVGTDITLYNLPFYHFFGGDARFDIYVPNGGYTVTGKFLQQRVNAAGTVMSVESQGIHTTNIDLWVSPGYQIPIDYVLPATVTNNILSFVVRHVAGSYTPISSFSITPGLPGTGTTITPGVTVSPGVQIQ